MSLCAVVFLALVGSIGAQFAPSFNQIPPECQRPEFSQALQGFSQCQNTLTSILAGLFSTNQGWENICSDSNGSGLSRASFSAGSAAYSDSSSAQDTPSSYQPRGSYVEGGSSYNPSPEVVLNQFPYRPDSSSTPIPYSRSDPYPSNMNPYRYGSRDTRQVGSPPYNYPGTSNYSSQYPYQSGASGSYQPGNPSYQSGSYQPGNPPYQSGSYQPGNPPYQSGSYQPGNPSYQSGSYQPGNPPYQSGSYQPGNPPYQSGSYQPGNPPYQSGSSYQSPGSYQPGSNYQSGGSYQSPGSYQPGSNYQSGGSYQSPGSYQPGSPYQSSGSYPSGGSYQSSSPYQSSGSYQTTGSSSFNRGIVFNECRNRMLPLQQCLNPVQFQSLMLSLQGIETGGARYLCSNQRGVQEILSQYQNAECIRNVLGSSGSRCGIFPLAIFNINNDDISCRQMDGSLDCFFDALGVCPSEVRGIVRDYVRSTLWSGSCRFRSRYANGSSRQHQSAGFLAGGALLLVALHRVLLH